MAHIVNITQKKASISDMLGYFRIAFGIGDTIKISSLGYFNSSFVNWGQFSPDSLFNDIKLKPRSYEIKEVKISWFSTYEKFLKGVSELQLPVSKEEEDIKKVNEYFQRTITKLGLVNLPGPTPGFTFGKDWYMKQNDKLNEFLEKEKQKRRIEKKYNAVLVSDLTGLTGNDVFEFMDYCAFSDSFLLISTDYEIQLKVMEKYKLFAEEKKNRKKATIKH